MAGRGEMKAPGLALWAQQALITAMRVGAAWGRLPTMVRFIKVTFLLMGVLPRAPPGVVWFEVC